VRGSGAFALLAIALFKEKRKEIFVTTAEAAL
jgi:hypothetical protein